MTVPPAIRRWMPLAAAVVLLDWSLPVGLLNRFFHSHRWFPTNITRVFAETLVSPGDPAAILVVSSSAPLFWVMGGLLTAAFLMVLRARRGGRLSRPTLVLFIAQTALFILAEFLLPWMNEKGFLRSHLTDFLFPSVTRGHGRAFGWLHAPAVLLFILQYRRNSSPSSA